MSYMVRYWSNMRRLQSLFLLLVAFTTLMVLLTCLSTVPPNPPRIRYMRTHRYISCADCFDGRRLGNQLFNYASLLGIAHTNNMTAILPETYPLFNVFQLKVKVVKPEHIDRFLQPYKKFEEYGRRACAYDIKSERLEPLWGYKLYGYYQSWKYFYRIDEELRKHLQFRPEILKQARSFLSRQVPGNLQGMDVVKVAVHVRRGDVISEKNRKYGYTVADAVYYKHAMDYFQQRRSKIVFIVCSENIAWAKENILGDNVVYSDQTDPAVDLAIMSLCDDTIISVGSYSWWAGWLVNGTTIYYEKWPRSLSILEYHVDKRQYFPPHWIPMS